ncbi:LIPaSe related [Caenorhabditis elegans]|uniref:LIPaSe related n=1 Tax=Caenorhabditis elegans TaxID=6239 RepID=Q19462_CAEEL|nr:LIPaSe related [Caenorhabditis elegans]CAA91408.1 LIPaSe related [Caenorhabditis elegans]|eukprot:NP_495777.1 LIPaSe related [Caenorhabditis elegans]
MHLFKSSLLLLIVIFGCAHAKFHTHFYNFLLGKFGKPIADDLLRPDLGTKGSFGGGNPNATGLPIVVIHGLAGYAGLSKKSLLNKYYSYGQPKGTVFATTYARGKLMDSLQHGMQCDYVLKVRTLILAVHEYTQKPVNIIACSMGSPITRKAILGGHCVDSGVNLGRPINHLIHNYVSVGGANHGAIMCAKQPFVNGICSLTHGLDCRSKFLQEINSQPFQYGKNMFAIYSVADEVIGLRNTCGEMSSPLEGATSIVKTRLMHGAVIGGTTEDQWRALQTS